MKIKRLVSSMAVSLVVIGLCVPQGAFAAAAAPPPAAVDVSLSDGGILHGQLVDLQGGSVANSLVTVKSQDQEVARATTTSEGRFTVQGLRGGVYQVAAGTGQGIYHLWAVNTAPPSAQKGAIVYTQCPQERSTWKMLLTNPIVIGAAVATAIAVPIALANSSSSSP
jgi:hypothetical protein